MLIHGMKVGCLAELEIAPDSSRLASPELRSSSRAGTPAREVVRSSGLGPGRRSPRRGCLPAAKQVLSIGRLTREKYCAAAQL
jgi:hypothetical protein